MTATAAVVWPDALYPAARPVHSLAFFTTLAAFPAARAERAAGSSRWGWVGPAWLRAVAIAGLAGAAMIVARDAVAARSAVQGVDFWAFVCFARDLASGATDVPMTRYFYFPGVYRFWRAALALGGGTLAGLQWVYLALLAANALAVGAVVLRVTRTGTAAAVAALWYVVLCSRFEGFSGSTEPIATFPVLVGVLAWAGGSFSGRAGFARAVALGAAIGAGTFTKQPAGLLGLGWFAMVVLEARTHGRAAAWIGLAAVPVSALTTFLLLILGEGHGFEPIRIGLEAVTSYGAESGLVANLSRGVAKDPRAAIASAAAVFAWIALLATRRRAAAHEASPLAVTGFASVAGFAALLQFTKRAYLHYALLAVPFLVIAAVVAAVLLLRRLPRPARAGALGGFVVILVAAIPFTRATGGGSGIVVWPPTTTMRFAPAPWSAAPDIARDVARLRPLLRPGEDVLLLPSRHNELHFLLGTRSLSFPLYGWPPRSDLTLGAARSATLAAALVVHGGQTDADRDTWRWQDVNGAIAELTRRGFVPVVELPTMTLWRRGTR